MSSTRHFYSIRLVSEHQQELEAQRKELNKCNNAKRAVVITFARKSAVHQTLTFLVFANKLTWQRAKTYAQRIYYGRSVVRLQYSLTFKAFLEFTGFTWNQMREQWFTYFFGFWDYSSYSHG